MKKYNMNKKSDMKRFERDLAKQVKSTAERKASSIPYDVECPHCHRKISVPAGKSDCPFCHGEVNLKLNVTWK